MTRNSKAHRPSNLPPCILSVIVRRRSPALLAQQRPTGAIKREAASRKPNLKNHIADMCITRNPTNGSKPAPRFGRTSRTALKDTHNPVFRNQPLLGPIQSSTPSHRPSHPLTSTRKTAFHFPSLPVVCLSLSSNRQSLDIYILFPSSVETGFLQKLIPNNPTWTRVG